MKMKHKVVGKFSGHPTKTVDFVKKLVGEDHSSRCDLQLLGAPIEQNCPDVLRIKFNGSLSF